MRYFKALLLLMVPLLLIPGAHATPGQVARGALNTFAVGIDRHYTITGHAQMVRVAEGKTIVIVHAMGLAPNTAYPAHVHKAACSDNFADGHYKFDPNGASQPPNEIWLGFTTDDDGVGNGKATADQTAGPTAVSVVVHDTDGKKIACADLS